MKNTRGAVLPLTLVILAILSIMALSLSKRSDGYLEHAIDYKAQWQAELAIHNAEQRVLLTMISGNFYPGAIRLGNTRLANYGEPYTLSNGVEVSLQDEAGLINVLHTRRRTTTRLLQTLGYEESAHNIANLVHAWQSPYLRVPIQLPPGARSLPFRSNDELLELPEISSDMFNGNQPGRLPVKDYLRVSGPGWMNFAAMPTPVMEAVLSLNPDQFEKIDDLRARNRWRELESLLRNYGAYGEGLEFSPSATYIVSFNYNNYRARGSYKLVSASNHLYEKRTWYFPDQDRF